MALSSKQLRFLFANVFGKNRAKKNRSHPSGRVKSSHTIFRVSKKRTAKSKVKRFVAPKFKRVSRRLKRAYEGR